MLWLGIKVSSETGTALTASETDTAPYPLSVAETAAKPYFLYVGRVIEPKGVHLAVEAAKEAGVALKIVGKRYGDDYFERMIEPHLGDGVEYVGFRRGAE